MKKNYVESIINYVESHIEEPLSIECIAREIVLSKVYLYKLFYIYTGMTLMDYCRKRKLEYARLALCKNTLVVDAAFKYGFNSSRSFSRAFTRQFHINPSDLKGIEYTLPDQISIKQIGGIKMLTYLSKPKVTKLEDSYCLHHQIISKEPEEDVITFMNDYRLQHNLNVLAEYGNDIPISEEDKDKNLRGYEYWLVISQDVYDSFKGKTVTKKLIPSANYMTLTITEPFVDPFERIPNAWKALIDYLKTDYDYSDNPSLSCLENVYEDNNKTYMTIYAPIK